MFRIAHISDLHIFNLNTIKTYKFFNRRVLGALNLILIRHNHSKKALLALLKSLKKENCDHVVITGDVSNFATDEEFTFIKEIFADLWHFDRLTILPGNHDFYTAGAFRHKRFNYYFRELLESSENEQDLFPMVKNFKDVTLVGLNSATLTPPLFSFGYIPEFHLSKLVEISENLQNEENRPFLMTALHHHLHKRPFLSEFTGRLLNRKEVIKSFIKARVDLVLHGHAHTKQVYSLEDNKVNIPVFCAGSATYISKDPKRNARYNIYSIENKTFTTQTLFYDIEANEFR